jgi:nitroreductase
VATTSTEGGANELSTADPRHLTVSAGDGEDGESPVDLFAIMRKRRMHRSFISELPGPEVLERLLWAAGRAPTARPGVRQFLVIDDPALMRTVRQTCPGFVNDAPMAILVFSDLNAALETVGVRGQEVIARIDAGTAAGYLSLAAPALGLGICITTSWTNSVVQELVGLPPHCRPEVLIAVGKVAQRPSRTVKAKPPAIHHNVYGAPWRDA